MNYYSNQDIFYSKDDILAEELIRVEKNKFDSLSIGKLKNIGKN